MSLDRRNRPGMKVTLLYDNPVPAPIRKGQPIGRLSFAGPGMESFDVPLVATADVDRLGFTGRIAAAASHLVWGNPKQ